MYVLKKCSKTDPSNMFIYHDGECYCIGAKSELEKNANNTTPNHPFIFETEDEAEFYKERVLAAAKVDKGYVEKADIHAIKPYVAAIKTVRGTWVEKPFFSKQDAENYTRELLRDFTNTMAKIFVFNSVEDRYDFIEEL